MNKKFLLPFAFFLIIFIFGTGYFYQKDFLFQKYLGYDVFFSKNNSVLEDSLKANISDTVSYHIVLPKDFGEKINIDTTLLKNLMDIESIEVNGEKQNSTNDISGKQNTQITIIGKPKSSVNFKNSQELIKIIPTLPIPIEKPIVEKISNIFIEKSIYAGDFNSIIEVSGSGQNLIKFVIIGDNSFELVQENNKFFINIPKNTFGNGEYFIFVQDTQKNIFPLDQKITFTFSNKELNVQSIVPNAVSNKNDQNIILQGRGFSKTISLQLSNNIVLKDTNFVILSDNVLQVKIPKGIEIGKYQLNVMTTKNIYQIQDIPFSITN